MSKYARSNYLRNPTYAAVVESMMGPPGPDDFTGVWTQRRYENDLGDSLDAPREVSDPTSSVYFIRAPGVGIKIGKAENAKKRLTELQCGSATPLHLVGTVPGGIPEERDYQRRFQGHRVRGEWFEERILADVIELIRAHGGSLAT